MNYGSCPNNYNRNFELNNPGPQDQDCLKSTKLLDVMKKYILLYFCLYVFFSGCSGVDGTSVSTMYTTPPAMVSSIYVMDFELDTAAIEPDTGILTARPGIVGHLQQTISQLRGHKDPEIRAKEVVDLMSESLAQELGRREFKAIRLGENDSLPVEGFLVRGVFTHVDEGNRLRRAFIGFESGETELLVVVSIDNLAQGVPKPLYDMDSQTTSGNKPGAVIMLNPLTAATKFVLSGHDLENNIKQTASQIADNITDQLR